MLSHGFFYGFPWLSLVDTVEGRHPQGALNLKVSFFLASMAIEMCPLQKKASRLLLQFAGSAFLKGLPSIFLCCQGLPAAAVLTRKTDFIPSGKLT